MCQVTHMVNNLMATKPEEPKWSLVCCPRVPRQSGRDRARCINHVRILRLVKLQAGSLGKFYRGMESSEPTGETRTYCPAFTVNHLIEKTAASFPGAHCSHAAVVADHMQRLSFKRAVDRGACRGVCFREGFPSGVTRMLLLLCSWIPFLMHTWLVSCPSAHLASPDAHLACPCAPPAPFLPSSLLQACVAVDLSVAPPLKVPLRFSTAEGARGLQEPSRGLPFTFLCIRQDEFGGRMRAQDTHCAAVGASPRVVGGFSAHVAGHTTHAMRSTTPSLSDPVL